MEYRHIGIGERWKQSERFRPKSKKIPPQVIPPQPRHSHGGARLSEASLVRQRFQEVSRDWTDRAHITSKGLIVEFESFPDVPLVTESWSTGKVPRFVLLNETQASDADGKLITKQRWFIRDGALDAFVRIFEDYIQKSTQSGDPMRRDLVNSIRQIRVAALDGLWTDLQDIPADEAVSWYEVWLRAGASDDERKAIVQQFKEEAESLAFTLGQCEEMLPEHTVLHLNGTFGQFRESVALMNCVAEIRAVGKYADYFDRLPVEQQRRSADDLLKRVSFPHDASLSVCLLDTGVQRGHPLIEPLISAGDNQSINDAWGVADDEQHGTLMAGLAAYGDLTRVLDSDAELILQHILEAVKVVPPKALLNQDERHAAEYTAQGVYKAEIRVHDKTRIWCLATSMDDPNDGRPSSWSARLDQLAAGVDRDDDQKRLFCVSSGNVPSAAWNDYPNSNWSYPVENPAQAWNVLCVGACTHHTQINSIHQSNGYHCISSAGGLAPSSRTSNPWNQEWPAKPDIVMEGGNAAAREQRDGPLKPAELLLLSTDPDYRSHIFGVFDGTSAATALAAQMTAQIQAAYPDYWPETIRGLMVHSAEWTAAMDAMIPRTNSAGQQHTDKYRRAMLLRTVGYGQPVLGSALNGQPNRVTLVAQAYIQPFKTSQTGATYNEYDIYTLPWPELGLEKIYDQDVRMRVTLSYFIEPNPGNRVSTRYRYPGCSLKFKVSSAGQIVDDLKADVNKFAYDDAKDNDREHTHGSADGWKIGPQRVFKGSLHSDIWEGSAAELLSMRHIAIFPTAGWWKTRLGLNRAESRIRYSLIISLEAPDVAVDLYTEIANQIAISVEVETN